MRLEPRHHFEQGCDPETITHAMDHLPAHAAQDLTAGGNQALIVMGDQTYILRITRAGKLILTK